MRMNEWTEELNEVKFWKNIEKLDWNGIKARKMAVEWILKLASMNEWWLKERMNDMKSEWIELFYFLGYPSGWCIHN